MSDFSPRSFKWTEILSLILEYNIDGRGKKEALDQLRQYARKRYKAENPIEERWLEYFNDDSMEVYAILVKMFGDP